MGETEYMNACLQNHNTTVNKKDNNQLVAEDFNENGHSLKNMQVIGIQKLTRNNTFYRRNTKEKLIERLWTHVPKYAK